MVATARITALRTMAHHITALRMLGRLPAWVACTLIAMVAAMGTRRRSIGATVAVIVGARAALLAATLTRPSQVMRKSQEPLPPYVLLDIPAHLHRRACVSIKNRFQ
jgi:hypothetical protein